MATPQPTVDDNGTIRWHLNGQLHRTDGPAVERTDGRREWHVHGKLHRTDGPAVERSHGSNAWYLNGYLHRTDGPAIEWADGTSSWWLNGIEVTEAEINLLGQEPFSVRDLAVELHAGGTSIADAIAAARRLT